MLLVLFRSGENLYAIEARRVVEVVPRVAVRTVPRAPDDLTGLMSYRGRVVPVIDFGVLTGGAPARRTLGSRVIVACVGDASDGRRVGLLAEDVSRVRETDATRRVVDHSDLEAAPYLGAVYLLDEGLVQVVDVGKLLSGRPDAALFGEPAARG
jgi:chemotaxis-related protein WspB